MRIHRLPLDLVRKIRPSIANYRYRQVARRQAFGDYQRIYFYHVRKTGGTSLMRMFLALSGSPADEVRRELLDAQPDPLIKGDYVYAGWQKPTIEAGNYYFSFSHIPMHELTLPKNTFTFTCLRDPVKRVVSHYRMLLDFSQQVPKHPCFAEEGPWLGSSFDDFLSRIPRHHLQNQLFMFSKRYCPLEACDKIKSLDFYTKLEELDAGIERLSALVNQKLEMTHSYLSKAKFQPTEASLTRLREMLDDEYQLMEHLRKAD